MMRSPQFHYLAARAAEAGKRSLWDFDGSKPAAVVFAAAFGVGAILHMYQMWRYKAWHFTVFIVGAFMMSIGYVFRLISLNNVYEMIPYIIQSLCILLPPSLYAATVYMLFGRIVLLVNAPQHSLIRPSRVTKIFVSGDVFAFFIQLGGGGMMAQEKMADTGNKVMLVGLFIQLLFFGFFVVVAGVFHFRVGHSRLTWTDPRVQRTYGKFHWSVLLKTLYVVAGLIIFRCVFRVVEFSQGHGGSIQKDEKLMYIFDTLPMLFVQSVFHVIHSGKVFPSKGELQQKTMASEGDLDTQYYGA